MSVQRSTRQAVAAAGLNGVFPCYDIQSGRTFNLRGAVDGSPNGYNHIDVQAETKGDWDVIRDITNGNWRDSRWLVRPVIITARNGTKFACGLFTFNHAPVIYGKAYNPGPDNNAHFCLHMYTSLGERKPPNNQYQRGNQACIEAERGTVPAAAPTAPAAIAPPPPPPPKDLPKLTGDSMVARLWNAIEQAGIKGVSDRPEHIAGIIGNLQSETTMALCPFQQEVKRGAGLGLMQWSRDRRAMLENYMSNAGVSRYDFAVEMNKHLSTYCDDAGAHPHELLDKVLAAQIGFMFYELTSTWEKFYLNFSDHPTNKYDSGGARAYAELFCCLSLRPGPGDDIKDPGVIQALKESAFVGGKGQLNRISYSELAIRRDRAAAVYEQMRPAQTEPQSQPEPVPEQKPQPQPASQSFWAVQCIAVATPETAQKVIDQLKAAGFNAYPYFRKDLHRAWVGKFDTEAEARTLEIQLQAAGFETYRVCEPQQ
ncbi:MAG: phage tail tip lysozyme [Defluviitaleaceae bacterium]|nr:phage tail tip lysozyme [Defluviitaleaceae bacterium]